MHIILAACIVFLSILVVVWDSCSVLYGVPQATISSILYYWSSRWPIFPFAVGVLAGHVFWGHHNRPS